MRNPLRVVAAVTVTAMLTLTGCSSATAPAGGASGAATASDPNALVIYTNSNSDGRAEWLTEQAKAAGFTVKIQGMGGGEVTNKLLAEKANPVADVTFGLNNMYFSTLKQAGTLEPYTPKWSGEVDAALGDQATDKAYWPLVQQGILLVYNGDKLSGASAPTDWPDLWTKPEFKGKYQTETGLGGATTQLVIAGILTRYKDPNGTLGVSQAGWDAMKAFFANGAPAEKGVDLYARMKKGTVDAGQMWSSGIPGFEKKYSLKTGIATPSVGVPYAIEQIAVVKGTKKAENAKKFIDWFGSEPVQSAWTAKFGSMPANKGSIAKTDPTIVKRHEGLKRQEIDWDFASKNMNAWVEKIQLEYMK